MVRMYHIGFLAVMLLMSMAMINPGGVVVEGQLEQRPAPGTSTRFTISVTKGGLEYFGRILISLPENCKLEARQLHGGGMTLDEERRVAVISWLKLPETDRFDLLFDLLIAPDATPGPRSMEWDFSFIRNNERVTVRPSPFHFDVVAGEEQALGVDSVSSKGQDISHPEVREDAMKPAAIRSIRLTSEGAAEVRIELRNLPEGGFVKLTEQWNTPCSSEILQGGGSVSQVTAGGASFLWFDYHRSGSVVYRLAECPLSEPGVIIGILSFIQDGESNEITVIQTQDEISYLDSSTTKSTHDLRIHYEVQVAATKKMVVTDYFEEKLNFSRPIEAEEHEGWYKFCTGSFANYAEARNEREVLATTQSFRGPFVVARHDNQRISVQEALMRTGQVWVP